MVFSLTLTCNLNWISRRCVRSNYFNGHRMEQGSCSLRKTKDSVRKRECSLRTGDARRSRTKFCNCHKPARIACSVFGVFYQIARSSEAANPTSSSGSCLVLDHAYYHRLVYLDDNYCWLVVLNKTHAFLFFVPPPSSHMAQPQPNRRVTLDEIWPELEAGLHQLITNLNKGFPMQQWMKLYSYLSFIECALFWSLWFG